MKNALPSNQKLLKNHFAKSSSIAILSRKEKYRNPYKRAILSSAVSKRLLVLKYSNEAVSKF